MLKSILRTTLIAATLAVATTAALAAPPAIMQAQKYHDDIVVSDYYVSEKLDGVRARWTGSELISRGGKRFAAPAWFVADFPAIPLDGELWSQRGEYQLISSITARKQPHDGWRKLRFMMFDLPTLETPFSERVAAMRKIPTTPFLSALSQSVYPDNAALMNAFDRVVAEGGEGLMLHHRAALYQQGRSRDLLKLKPYQDAEAVVTGYRAGKGKYQGLIGALKVRVENISFYIGSGLSDDDRNSPPAIGSVVTYRHQGFTDSGIPRFAVFLRRRAELDEEP